MGKLDPIGDSGEESGSITGGWCEQLLGRPTWQGSYMGRRLNTIWLKLRILGLVIKRKNLSMCVKIKFVCFVCWSAILSWEKIGKNVYKNLTEMLMCFCCCDVAEWTCKWYCCGYGLVSNVVTAFKYHIWRKNVACMCGELWRKWWWYVIEKSGTSLEELDMKRV